MSDMENLLRSAAASWSAFPPHRPLSAYNLFGVLEISAREVLMCRVLADLLDPEGQHGCGILFLKSFLRDVLHREAVSDVLLAHTVVGREFPLEKGRRIDIVIQNARFQIPIEVKIYADEQEGQCCDYYAWARDAKIVYLTRFGSAPSPYSRKGASGLLPADRIQCISWAHDVCRWLTGLLSGLEGPVRQAVEQYVDAIHTVADEGERKGMEKQTELVLESPAYFHAGLQLERGMKSAKTRLIHLVFEDLEREMERVAPRYGLEPETEADYYDYRHKSHEKFYDCYSTYPGLNYVVRRAEFQEKGLRMWFRIEVEHCLFAGFALFDLEAASPEGGGRGYQVDEITREQILEVSRFLNRDLIMPADWWLAWCYPTGKRQQEGDVPDFKEMNPCAVRLVDPEVRREYARRAVNTFEEQLLRFLL